MLTSFIHIGDTHLHSGHPRNAARLAALDQIIAEGSALPTLGAWLWPGDLFHGRSTVEDRNALIDRVLRMAARAPVVVCPGNHGQESQGDLDFLARLRGEYPIYVVTQPRIVRFKAATGVETAIAVLPYPQKAGLIAAGVTADATLQAGHEALAAILRDLGAWLESARLNGDLTAFIGHVNVAGSRACAGQPQIGRELELDPHELGSLGGCYIGLNHIHEPQEVGGAHYAGSIAPMDWGEVTPRSYNVIDCRRVGDVIEGYLWDYTVTRCPIRAARLIHVEGTLNRTGFTLESDDPDIGRRFLENDWGGCEVRVRFSFLASERSCLDEAVLQTAFSSAERLQLEPVAIPDRALRAPEVASAKTLREKVDAWARLNGGAAVPATVCDKLARLEHDDAAQLLTEVANQVAAAEKGGVPCN